MHPKLSLPASLEWLAAFGFKVGVFLCLKSFIVVRYVNITFSGIIVVLTELILAVILIGAGTSAQRPNIMEKPSSVFFIGLLYMLGAILGGVVCFLRGLLGMHFALKVESGNILLNAFNSLTAAMKELILSLMFYDLDLWSFLCLMLGIIMIVYVCAERFGRR